MGHFLDQGAWAQKTGASVRLREPAEAEFRPRDNTLGSAALGALACSGGINSWKL